MAVMLGWAVTTTACGPVASCSWMPAPALTSVNAATLRVSEPTLPEPTTMPPVDPMVHAVISVTTAASANPKLRRRSSRSLLRDAMVASLLQRAGGGRVEAGPKVPRGRGRAPGLGSLLQGREPGLSRLVHGERD